MKLDLMIKGMGTDLVDVSRMASKIEKQGFLEIVFTTDEIAYCSKKKYPSQHFSARFAAKEAYMKALGSGWSKEANFKEIEVLNDKQGAPRLNLKGATLLYFDQSNFKHIFVSLSHTTSMASATVIITD